MADAPAIRITAVDAASPVIAKVGASLQSFAATVLSMGAVVESVRRSIALGDDLKRMADSTGLAIAKLDQLQIIAGQNGASLDDLARSWKFLGANMVEAQTASTQAAKVFSALGVSVKDSAGNLRGVDAVMQDTAKALDSIENETTRAAIGNAIFGKSYQQIAATLRNFKADQEAANDIIQKFGGVSVEAANLADQLGDRMTLLGEGSKRALLGGLVPGLAAASQALLELINTGGGFQRSFGDVISEVTIFVAQRLIELKSIFEVVGETIGALFAVIATRSLQPLRDLPEQIARINAASLAATQRVASAAATATVDDGRAGNRWADSANRQAEAAARAAAALRALAPVQKVVISDYEKLEQQLTRAIAATDKLTESERIEAEILKSNLTPAQKEMLRFLAATVDFLKEREEATKRAIDADKEFADAMHAANKAQIDATKNIEEWVKEVEFEAEALTMTNREREIAIALRKLEKDGIIVATDALEGYRQRLLAAMARKEVLQQQIDLWTGIEQAAEDAFMHIFEGGKSVWERLTASLKNTLLKLLYEMTVKQWIVQIAASVTGNAGILGGAANAASAAGGVSGFLSNPIGAASNVWSAFSGGASSAATGFATSGVGQFIGMSQAGAAIPGASGAIELAGATGLTEFGSMFVAAAPWLAIGAIAIPLVLNYLNSKRGGPKSGGFAVSGDMGELTRVDSSGRWTTPSDADSVAQVLSDTTLNSYNAVLKAFGGTGKAGFGFAFNTDPKGTAPNWARAGATVNGRSVYDVTLPDLGRDEATLKAALETESKRALLAALQASSLPTDIANILNSISATGADSAQIDTVLGLAEAFALLNDVLNGAPMDDALAAIAAESATVYDKLTDAATGIRNLLDEYDGSLDMTNALVAATQNYYMAQVQLLIQTEKAAAAISSMFDDTIRTLTLQTLGDQDKYNFYQDEAEQLRAQLQASSDPATIQAMAEKINADIQAAFNLLGEDQQKTMLPQYVENIKLFNEEVKAKLESIKSDVQDGAGDLLAEVRDKMSEVAAQMKSASDVQSDAAGMQLEAARTPLTVVLQSNTTEVNG